MNPPPVSWRDLSEGAADRFSPVSPYGGFLGTFSGGDVFPAVVTEDRLCVMEDRLWVTEQRLCVSDSPSVFAASSLELESGLVVPTELFCPLDETGEAIHGMLLADLSFCWDELVLDELFCSEECEERDSMLPIGVLLGLLLKVSPEKKEGKASETLYGFVGLYG